MISEQKENSSNQSQTIDCILDPKSGVGGLYIGSKLDALDKTKLKKLNITSVLTVARGLEVKFNPETFTHKVIPAEDFETFNIAQYFDDAIKFIHVNIKTRNLLIHCQAGMSRSSAIVIAYLLAEKKMELMEALKYARSRRTRRAGPNPGFFKQLEAYEKTLKALESTTIKNDSTAFTNQTVPEEDQLKATKTKETTLEKVIYNETVIEDEKEDDTQEENREDVPKIFL